jgi:hypothetical protein
MVRRIAFASLCGAGLTALLSLALNLWYVNLLAFLLLTPGGLIQAFLIKAVGVEKVLEQNALSVASVRCRVFLFQLG